MQLKPETERLVEDEIKCGHFHSVDELILEGVDAWREKHHVAAPQKHRKRLYNLLTQPPFAGSELNFERQKDHPRAVDL